MERTVRAIEIIAAVIMAAVALFVFLGVFSRYVFNFTLPDAFEASKYLQGIALSWGFAVATYHGSHIVVDVFWEMADRRGRWIIDVFASACTAIAMLAIAYAFIERIGPFVASGRVTNELKLPVWWFYLPMAAGMAATGVMAVLAFLKVRAGRPGADRA